METMSVPVPGWLHRALRKIKYSLVDPPKVLHLTLEGDKDVERSFVAAHIPPGPGTALDFGCNGTTLSLIAAFHGYETTALDLEPCGVPWSHPKRRFVQSDLLGANLAPASFDLIMTCSTVEHVGLTGRYGVTNTISDGDLEAMAILRKLMKPSGIQILTIPVGRDAVFAPWHRVYGGKRLPLLLREYSVVESEYWRKANGAWAQCSKDEALSFEAVWDDERHIYAVGCFVLRGGQASQ